MSILMRESDINVLTSVGLSKSEAAIYLDLVRNPLSPPVDIAKRCKFHRPNIYDGLRRLKEMGLVIESIEIKGKRFSALNPRKLKLYLKQKESELDELIEDLKKIPQKQQGDKKVELLEGVAIKNEILDFLEKGEQILIEMNPNSNFGDTKFLNEFNEKRIEKKIPVKIIFSKNGSEVKEFSKIKYVLTKVIKTEGGSELITIIVADTIYYFLMDKTLIKIKQADIANERRLNFERAWEMKK